MGGAKDIRLNVIPSQIANDFVRRWHYSGTVAQNSQLHFGAFLNGVLHGVMSFGPSLDKRKIQGLVSGTKWNEFIELNRMAFDDTLPRNSESRCIAIAMKLLRKHATQIKWVISFADGAQCGDGAIYRASGFVLTGIKLNNQIWVAPTGDKFTRASLTGTTSKQKQRQAIEICRKLGTEAGGNILQTGASSMKGFKDAGFKPIPGFQLRYIYFIDPAAKEKLSVPILHFSKIDEMGAGMYKGEQITRAERRPKHAPVEQGSSPGSQPGGDGQPDPGAQTK